MTRRECEEVLDIADMYLHLQQSFERLEDRTGIEEWKVTFPGFDGNYETKQLAYFRYLRYDDNRFTNLPSGDDRYNSHHPTLDRSRGMLAVWQDMDRLKVLTREEILRVVEA